MAHVNGALKVVDEFSAPTAVWLRPSRIRSFCLTRVDETDSECERHVVTVDWVFCQSYRRRQHDLYLLQIFLNAGQLKCIGYFVNELKSSRYSL